MRPRPQARKRTLDRRSILLGLPAHNPVLHRSARNIEGVKVAPVAEFNTYDILKQRYLVLTREALIALKEQVKHETGPARGSRPAVSASPRSTGSLDGELIHGHLAPSTPIQRSGPVLEPYQVVIRPLITEKATHLSERHNAYTFEVNPLATKTEIKNAIETLFNVKVADVRTQNRRGKPRRYRLKVGRMRNWKKAIVTLHEEYRIDFY